MKKVRKTLSILDCIYYRCINSGAALAGVLIVCIMLLTSADVLMRKFLFMPIKGSIEISEYFMIWITFLGAAWVLKQEGHVKVDVLLTSLKPRSQALLNAATSYIMAAICLFLTVWGGIVTHDVVIRGAARVYQFTVPLWILVIIIPISSFFLFIQSIKRARGYMQLTGKDKGLW